jgi:hypothetical protein
MRIFLFLFYTLISIFTAAQTNEFTPADLKDRFAEISVNRSLPAGYKLPFSSIRIIDCRPDTSKIGFIRKNPYGSGDNAFRKIVVRNGLRQSLENILNEHYQSCFSNDTLQLLIVIKRFWADPFPNRQLQQQGEVIRSSLFDMYLKLEFFFVKNDWYYPLKRIDTLFQTGEGEPVTGCNDRKMKDCEMYGHAVSKIFEAIDFNYYSSRIDKAKNKLTKYDLDSFIRKYNDYPILNAELLNQGVYLNFNEFRNNAPSIVKYKIQKIKKDGVTAYSLYNLSNGEPERIAKYWGYCNGENIYCGYMQHRLIRAGSTFEFFIDEVEYSANYSSITNQYGTIYVPYSTITKKLEPFQIDMETGKVY